MTKKEKEERIERLRQHPAFKELVEILRKQQPDRVGAFMDECEHREEHNAEEDSIDD